MDAWTVHDMMDGSKRRGGEVDAAVMGPPPLLPPPPRPAPPRNDLRATVASEELAGNLALLAGGCRLSWRLFHAAMSLRRVEKL